MKKKIISIITIISLLLMTVSVSEYKEVEAADTATIQLDTKQLAKYSGSTLTVSMKDNSKTVAGVELFIAFDTDAFQVESVKSLLANRWELDWVEKGNATYGSGIHCMIQDSKLEGFTAANKDIMEISLDGNNATSGKTYDFEIYIIDICDEQGESIKSSVTGVDSSIQCVDGLRESEGIQIVGYQISTMLKGFRTVATVEPEINGQKVVEFGNVYAIVLGGVTEDDVYVGSDSMYVASFEATDVAISSSRFTESETAINYVMTIVDNGYTAAAYTQEYMVRGYAKLEDGSYVYSDVGKYSIYEVAKYLYDNVMMPSFEGHNYLYNDILKVVNENYKELEYDWNNTIVNP